MNIYVGNLSYTTRDESLRAAFEQFGQVDSARVIMDRETDRSRGFGFVEMPVASEGQAAIKAMDNADLDGRAVKVNEARPKADDDRRGGGGGGGYGRGGGGRY
jgi:RNA recognition motif-containing protein